MGKIGTSFRAGLSQKLTYQITAVLCYDYCEYAIFNSKSSLLVKGSFPISDDKSIEIGLQKAKILELNISKFYLASTLAPLNFVQSKLYKPTKLKSYFKNIYPSDKLPINTLTGTKLKSQTMYVAYGVPKGILASFKKHFPKLKMIHLSEAVCNYAKKKKHNGSLVLVGEGFVAISCHNKGNSYFYNKFDCFGESDVLYYLSLVFEVLELDAAKEHILIGGYIPKTGSLSKLLKPHFKRIKWITGFDRYCRKAPAKGALYAAHFLIKN